MKINLVTSREEEEYNLKIITCSSACWPPPDPIYRYKTTLELKEDLSILFSNEIEIQEDKSLFDILKENNILNVISSEIFFTTKDVGEDYEPCYETYINIKERYYSDRIKKHIAGIEKLKDPLKEIAPELLKDLYYIIEDN